MFYERNGGKSLPFNWYIRQKKLFKSLLKNKKLNLVKKTSKILDHRDFSNITMPSNIYLFKVSIGSTGTDVKYLLS